MEETAMTNNNINHPIINTEDISAKQSGVVQWKSEPQHASRNCLHRTSPTTSPSGSPSLKRPLPSMGSSASPEVSRLHKFARQQPELGKTRASEEDHVESSGGINNEAFFIQKRNVDVKRKEESNQDTVQSASPPSNKINCRVDDNMNIFSRSAADHLSRRDIHHDHERSSPSRELREQEVDTCDVEVMGQVPLECSCPDGRSKGIVMIDMDNTLVDWDAQFVRIMRNIHPEIPILDPDSRKNYQMELNYDEQYRNAITELSAIPDFWSSMRPAPGAIRAVREMVEENLSVFIVTAPDSKYTARCAKEKLDWVQEMLGPLWKSRVNLCSDKTLMRGDVLIDDKPTVADGLLTPVWAHVLYCQPYNLSLSDRQPVICHWKDWRQVVMPMLEDRRQRQDLVFQRQKQATF